MMRGIGGPLLSVGDLLSDIGGEPDTDSTSAHHSQPSDQTPNSPHASPNLTHLDLQPSDLSKLFQESYDQLNKALAGSDHSWTSLTLKLYATLDTAKKLIESSNSNVLKLSEKVGELEKIISKGDSAMAEVRSIHSLLSQRIASSGEET